MRDQNRLSSIRFLLLLSFRYINHPDRIAGISGGYHWSHAKIKVSNALDLAIRECLEEAVYEMVIRHGATALTKTAAPATTTTP